MSMKARRHHIPGVDHARGLPASRGPTATIGRRPPRRLRDARMRAAAVDQRAVSDDERPGQRYSSAIVTEVIVSPCLMRSTCSIPDTTRPNTVYGRRGGASRRSRCRTGSRPSPGSGLRAIASVPRSASAC